VILFGLDKNPVTVDGLLQRLKTAAKGNPDLTLSINADKDAPWGLIVKVRDAAKDAGIKNVQAAVDNPAAR
jgi:biopolymer transport protein ExbD